MSKKRGRGNRKKNVKIIKDRESVSAKLGEHSPGIESLSKPKIPSTRRRSKRKCVTVDTTCQCEICNLTFSNEYNLRQHLDYYGDPKYPCKECKTKFTDKRQLQSHISNAHHVRPNRKFTAECFVCKQMFALSTHLQAHLSHYHEDCKETIKTEEDPVKYPKKVKIIETGSPDFIKNDGNSVKNSKKTIKTHLQTERNQCDQRSREEEQTASKNAQNTDVLCKRTENQNKTEDTTRKDENPIYMINKNSNVLCNQLEIKAEELINEDTPVVFMNWENEDDYQDLKKELENKSHQIIRKNDQVLYLIRENSQTLEPQRFKYLEDKTEWGKANRDKQSNFQSRLEDNEDENDQKSREHEKHSQPAAIEDPELGKPINEGIKPLVTTRGVPNDEFLWLNLNMDELEEKDMDIESIRSSNHSDLTDNFEDIRVITSNKSGNVPLLDVRSSDDKIAEKSLNGVRNYEKEMELRRLYSCKECYVPLTRVQNPETSNETAKAAAEFTKSRLHTVFPSIVCDKTFVTKSMMFRHYRQQHFRFSNNKVHCVCGKKMNSNEALRFHFHRYSQKVIHTDAKPTIANAPCKPLEKKFACKGCGEKFWVESCLRSHAYKCGTLIKEKMLKILKARDYLDARSKHICRVCHSTFSTKERLLGHEKMYSRTAIYRCTFCGMTFSGERQLKRHVKITHILNAKVVYVHKCSICDQGFTKKKLLRIHKMHIHRDQILENNHKSLPNNCPPSDSDKPEDDETSINKCNVCNIVFSNKKRFIDHTIYYMKSEIIHCKICDENFKGQYKSHHHNKIVHYSADLRMAFTHHCNICKEGFMFMTHLQAHMFHVHINEMNIVVSVDQNDRDEFVSQQNSSQSVNSWLHELRDRNAVTVPSLEHACAICDVRFLTQAILAAHKVAFANDGEYLCNRCSRRCRTSAMLLDHITLNHSNNQLQDGVKCRHCNENFLTPNAWVSHVKHFHGTEEPSEFYLERNLAITEKTGDIRYEMIPTNESILNGVTYLNIKNSIDSPKSSAIIDNKESSVADVSPVNVVVPEEEKLMAHTNKKTEETSFNFDKSKIEVIKLEEDEPVINDVIEIIENESLVDTSTANLTVLDKGQSVTNKNDQAMKTNFDAGQIKMVNTEKNKATTTCWKVPKSTKRIYDKDWNCDTCDYAFPRPGVLAKHMALYSDSGHHMCEKCGRRFQMPWLLRKHKRNHILKNIEYLCSLCSEGFGTYQEMKMHMAHFHSKLQGLSSKASDKNSAHKRQESNKSLLWHPQGNTRGQRNPETNFSYSSILPSFVKESNPHLRTYSRKHRKPPAKVRVEDHAAKPKNVVADEPPRLHTEVFDDEISMIYECPKFQKKYSTTERLNEDLTDLHTSNRVDNEFGKPLKTSDDHVVCDICKSVFANKDSLNTHREELHCIKLVELVRSSVPVLEITAPVQNPKDRKNEQQSVVIGRLYKLNVMNVLPKPVDHDKKETTKQFTAEKVIRENTEQQKLMATNNAQKQTSGAVQLKSTTVNDADWTFQRLNVVQRKANVEEENSPNPERQKLPQPEQLKLTTANDALRTFQRLNVVQRKAKVEDQNSPNPERQKLPQPEQQNPSMAEQLKPPKSEHQTKLVRITSTGSEIRSVLKHVIPSDVVTPSINSSPWEFINPIKIVKVESCSSIASSSVHAESHCQFTCKICNIVFINRNQLTTHENSVHSFTSLNKGINQSIDNSFTAPTLSSVDQLRQLVNSLPIQPYTGTDTEPQISCDIDFESVLIPVSTDDFDFCVDKSPNTAESERQINPNEKPAEKSLSLDNLKAAPLKVRPFAKIVQNLRKKNYRKRKNNIPIDTHATKRRKQVFDPVAYEELCRQHNLIPKSLKPKSSSNTRKSKAVTEN